MGFRPKPIRGFRRRFRKVFKGLSAAAFPFFCRRLCFSPLELQTTSASFRGHLASRGALYRPIPLCTRVLAVSIAEPKVFYRSVLLTHVEKQPPHPFEAAASTDALRLPLLAVRPCQATFSARLGFLLARASASVNFSGASGDV